ncbi:TPR-like protein [Eremomyces bilateralis CBS 781.70]|uniref:TPR-like protein n=1 Tax=Eremomyces bilateralis CBS 781.70 TaxID=1392243 RepID=A0A6G1G1N8_9PEZI|nr:TPR-like protein [Eremomyces bilateralis CBS 781.70]KAF1811841.1 TPR-like protein [Eremomyces bilateralis CBS 781.70]
MDILLEYFESCLPSDLKDALVDELHAIKQGDFSYLLQHPVTQLIVGRTGDGRLKEASDEDYDVWSDFIFDRLGVILSKRADSNGGITESPAYYQHLVSLVGLAALYAFIQSNVTGPPLQISPQDVLFPSKVIQNRSTESTFRRGLLSSLTADGIGAYQLANNVELFCLADTIFTCPPLGKNIKAAKWIKLRVDFLHQRMLSEIAPSLEDAIYASLVELEPMVLQDSKDDGVLYTNFLLERATIHTHHGMDKKAHSDITQAVKERQFEFAITGRLGKRTKFQENDLSQLVVLARSRSEDHDDTTAPDRSTGRDTVTRNIAPENVDLNDDTILDSISFTPAASSGPEATKGTIIKDPNSIPPKLADIDPSSQPLLHPLDSIILLSTASSITNTNPADGLTREETAPYATRVLDGGSSNWQVYTQGLLVRSRIEGYRSRTTERGLLQLQALVDQIIVETSGTHSDGEKDDKGATSGQDQSVPLPTIEISGPNGTTSTSSDSKPATFLPAPKPTESAPVMERLQYVFQLSSPYRWNLESELAARWVGIGGLRTALEIYERLQMWAEAALCWAATEREDKAIKIVRRQLYHATDERSEEEAASDDLETWEGSERDPLPSDAARLFCILGDIDMSPIYFDRAWEVSSHRYARAKRSLGRYFYARKDFQSAADAYEASVKVAQLHHGSWFNLGCSYLELQNWTRAIDCFSRTVQLDDQDAESWSNLAAALIRLDPKQAIESAPQVPEVPLEDEDLHESSSSLPAQPTSQSNRIHALSALQHAARLKPHDYHIWSNIMAIALSLADPPYATMLTCLRRLVDLQSQSLGENAIDAEALAVLISHITSTIDSPVDANLRGLPRLLSELIESKLIPLITSSAELWALIARFRIWERRPAAALDAQEKAWRCTLNTSGWESGDEKHWGRVVDSTIDLAQAYESLGPQTHEDQIGTVVLDGWKFKARSALRSVMGKGKESWDGSDDYNRLKEELDGLRS